MEKKTDKTSRIFLPKFFLSQTYSVLRLRKCSWWYWRYFHENADVALGGPSNAGQFNNLNLQQLVTLHTETDANFIRLQNRLVKHYKLRWQQRSVYWLRSLSWHGGAGSVQGGAAAAAAAPAAAE